MLFEQAMSLYLVYVLNVWYNVLTKLFMMLVEWLSDKVKLASFLQILVVTSSLTGRRISSIDKRKENKRILQNVRLFL